MLRQILTPISELIAAQTGHGESYIHRIKDAIAAKIKTDTGCDISFDVDINVLSIIFDLSDGEKIFALLDKFQSKGLLTYKQQPFGHSKLQAQIDMMNPAICDNPALVEQSPEDVKKFVEAEARKAFAERKPDQLEFRSKPKPIRSNEILKSQLNDHAWVAALFQQADSLSALSIVNPDSHKREPLIPYVLRHFTKCKYLAEMLMMECICRGNLTELQSLLSVKVQGSKETTKTTVKLFSPAIQIEEKVATEQYSYVIKANFEIKQFAAYVKQKREQAADDKYLGLKEDVVACIQYVCGISDMRSQQLIASLDKLDAYQSMQDLFSFGR